MNKETISSDSISAASLVNYVNRVLNLGLDVHYRQVTVAMQETTTSPSLKRGFDE